LLPLCGEPLLFQLVNRVNRARLTGIVVVATTEMPEDDSIVRLCDKKSIHCFRGSLHDLLDRHYQLAKEYCADALVKIPSDCPLIDPSVIDLVIGYYLKHPEALDYVSNLHPPTWPDGNDVEIMSFETLKSAWENAQRDFEREHTTPYIWENPDQFRIGNVTWPLGYDFSATHRWTIDYEEDYLFINEVYKKLYTQNPAFNLNDILSLIERFPEISQLNKDHTGHYWYNNHLDELKTIDLYKFKLSSHEA
jgi:spore coat polysaccharide biosynthesis protein SpsF